MSEAAKPVHAFPALYATLYRILVDVGRENGYAMALHGSLARDLDVVAVPWTEDASSAEDLVGAVLSRIGGFAAEAIEKNPRLGLTPKPHGRRAATILLDGEAFIDLSVMPRAS